MLQPHKKKDLKPQPQFKKHVPQTLTSKAIDVAENPLGAVGHLLKEGRVPDNFAKNKINVVDRTLQFINPVSKGKMVYNKAKDIVDNPEKEYQKGKKKAKEAYDNVKKFVSNKK